MKSWLQRLFRSAKTNPIRNSRRRIRLELETLEDRLAPAVSLLSQGDPPGTPANNSSSANNHSEDPVFARNTSDDGRFVVFTSRATNLVPGQVDANNTDDVFRLDRQTGQVSLLSHTGDGLTTGGRRSINPQISHDGGTVTFRSEASNLVAGFVDGNDVSNADVYRWSNGVVTLVSGAGGSATQGGNASSGNPALSGDGSAIVFESSATDLVAGFVNSNAGSPDVFRWSGGVVTLVSGMAGSPTAGGNGQSYKAVISRNGGTIAFLSFATDLVAGFVNANGGGQDVFRWSGGVVTLVSGMAGSPTTSSNGSADDPVISGDGSVIAFASSATDLVAGFVNGNGANNDIYRWSNGVVTLVSGAGGSATQGGNANSVNPTLSGDGSAIAFESSATDLVTGFVNGNGGSEDIYRWSGGLVTLVSAMAGSSSASGNAYSDDPVISSDGSAIAFKSIATDLVAGFVNGNGGSQDIFRWSSGVVRLASGAGGSPTQGGNGNSQSVTVSPSGTLVLFDSSSSDLVAGDTNGFIDVFGFVAQAPPIQAVYNWDDAANTLVIQLGTGESLTVSETAGVVTFTLDVGIFSHTQGDSATGDGTATITFNNEDLASSLQIGNDADAGTNNVTFSGAGSLSSAIIAVSITDPDAIGTIAFTGGFDISATTAIGLTTDKNISVGSDSVLSTSGSGTIGMSANEQATPTSGNFSGIEVFGGTIQTTGTGDISLTGRGGDDTAGFQSGIRNVGGTISSTASGNIILDGVAGVGDQSDGVQNAGSITSTGSGNITIMGASSGGVAAEGIANFFTGSSITTAAGWGNIKLIADNIFLDAGFATVNAGMNTVTLNTKTADGSIGIDIGGADSATALGLTDGELDTITAGTIHIGDDDSTATITVSAPITFDNPAGNGPNLTLDTEGTLNLNAAFDTDGGTLLFNAANINAMNGLTLTTNSSGTATFTQGTLDVGASPGSVTIGGPLAFTANLTYHAEIDGPTAGTDYDQITGNNGINLGNATLDLAFGFTPAVDQSFTLFVNQDSGAIVGAFAGLPEGKLFTVGGLVYQITYQSTSNNHVAVTRIAAPVNLVVDKLGDVSDGNFGAGEQTLREAIELANVLDDANTITFDQTVFGTPRTITLGGTQLPNITEDVTITGPAAGLTIDANHLSRLFTINSEATVELARLSLVNGRTGENGGGIFNSGMLTLTDSTLSGNSSTFSLGGGIFNSGSLRVTNSTLSGNSAGEGGGAIFNTSTLTVVNSTIVFNQAGDFAGGIRTGTATLNNTIVAGNTITGGGVSDIAGTVTTDSGFNLIGDAASAGGLMNGVNGNLVGVDPLLGPLADNGGPTMTQALLAGSPAINAGDPAFTPPPDTDQRGTGFDRVKGGRVDIGAFESDAVFTGGFDAPDGSDLGDDFTLLNGRFTIVNGQVVAQGKKPAQATIDDLMLADVALEVDVDLSGKGSRAGLIARYSPAAGNRSESYYWARLINRNGQVRAEILQYRNGAVKTLAFLVTDLSGNEHLRFEVFGSSLKLFVNGDLKVFANDDSLTGPGLVGIRARQGAAIDNLVVNPLTATQVMLPFSDNFSQGTNAHTQLSLAWMQQLGAFTLQQQGPNIVARSDAETSIATLNGLSASSLVVEAEVALNGTNTDVGFVTNYTNGPKGASYYWAYLAQDNEGAITANVVEVVNGKVKTLPNGQVLLPAFDGTILRALSFFASGGSLQLVLEGQAPVTVTDATPLAAGTVGLRASLGSNYANFQAFEAN